MNHLGVIIVLLSACLVTGCVGTLDAVTFVEGSTPNDQICSLGARQSGTSDAFRNREVQGDFSESYTGPFHYDFQLVCGGKLIAKVENVPPSKGLVELIANAF